MLLQKSFETKQERIVPKDADLAAIAEYAVRSDVSAEDYFCGRMRVCNTQVDRSHEQFPVSYLKRFAETLPGKALMPGHDYTQMPIGRFYGAGVEKDGDVHHLVGKYFVDATDQKTVRGIELGVLKDVSIGFKAGGRQCNLCEKEYHPWFAMMSAAEKAASEPNYCEHEPGKSYDGQPCTLTYTQPKLAEAMETSFVWLGCQYDAATTRSARETATLDQLRKALLAADFSTYHALKGISMDEITELKAAMVTRDQELASLKAALDKRDQELKGLQPLLDESAFYRSYLRSEIKRLYDSAEMGPTGAAILSGLENANADSLEKARKDADEFHKKLFTPQGAGRTDGPPGEGRQEQQQTAFDPTRRRPLVRRTT